jgi:hypothetical protein
MTDASKKLPISIDYTSRDFYSLKEDLVARVKANIPTWSGDDPADFGVALIEAFAYMGDVANYYIDRVANESYLTTATQRSAILGHAKALGYTVDGYRAATTTLTFGNSSSSSMVIPSGTVVYTDILVNQEIRRIRFMTDESITVPSTTALSSSSFSVGATQGYPLATVVTTNAELVETGVYGLKLSGTTGQANQEYTLNDSNVTDGSLNVYIYDGSNYVKWTRVTNISLYNRNDRVYTSYIGEDDFIKIQFGDGVSGAIPPASNEIYVAYNLSDGIYGNIAENKVGTAGAFILYSPGKTSTQMSALMAATTFTNTFPAVGGANPESNASIRAGAQTVAGTVLRAVTLLDYENIALTSSNIGKVKAYAYNYSNVTLFVAPKRDRVIPSGVVVGAADLYPGYNQTNTETTNEMRSLVSEVYNVVTLYSQIGVSVTVSPVKYTPINVGYTYRALPGFSSVEVGRSILEFLSSRLSYINAGIADTLTPEALLKEIISVNGVATATITKLSRSSSGVNTIIGQPGEVLVISTDTIVGVNQTDVKLSALTATWNGSTTAPSVAFNADIFSYIYPVSGTLVAGFAITPTISPDNVTAGAVITVGGSIVASGTAITIPVTLGTNVTTISVTDIGGIKTNYTITIIRGS